VVSVTCSESDKYGLRGVYIWPTPSQEKIELFHIRVLMLRYDLSNVQSLHDIAIKDVDFKGRDI